MTPILLGVVSAVLTCLVIAFKADMTHTSPGLFVMAVAPVLVGLSAIAMAVAVRLIMGE